MTRTLFLGLILALPFIFGCQGTTVRTTAVEPIVRDAVPPPEDELLDVGVILFDPGTDGISDEEASEVAKQIRRAESRYMPVLLVDTLQNSGNWGVVRVVPSQQTVTDVYVTATLRRSDGLHLVLDVEVADISGKTWFSDRYEETASKFSYDHDIYRENDPFQGLYNRVANDMHQYVSGLSSAERMNLRTIAQLKFARIFSPEQYGEHLTTNRDDIVAVQRLPASNDPTMQRIQKIRERDYIFTDLLQDYYLLFHRQTRGAYNEWREDSYRELDDLRHEKSRANAQIIGGALALAGGIAAGIAGGGNMAAQGAAIGAAVVGYPMLRAGLERKARAQEHVANLEEIAESLNTEIEPHYIDLDDRTFRLTGTLDEQYAQWRQILMDIYREETGLVTPGTD